MKRQKLSVRILRQSRRAGVHRGLSLLDVVMGTMLIAFGVIAFASLYPTASQSARMTSEYSQAIAAVQHKVDQMRAIGYGRITYTDLKNIRVIDASPTVAPYRFDGVDSLANYFQNPVGTISVSAYSATIRSVTVTLTWNSRPTKTSSHAITTLIAQE